MILDYIGGDYAEKNIKLLAEEGRMVIIGFMKGPRVLMAFSLLTAGKYFAEPDFAQTTHHHRIHIALAVAGIQASGGDGDVREGLAVN